MHTNDSQKDNPSEIDLLSLVGVPLRRHGYKLTENVDATKSVDDNLRKPVRFGRQVLQEDVHVFLHRKFAAFHRLKS